MKNKTLLGIIILILMITGCEKGTTNKLRVKASFTITCVSPIEKLDVMDVQNVITYYFNKKQYATDYIVETTQKFKKKENYEAYKRSQEETSLNSTENLKYRLYSDDEKLELRFITENRNIDLDKEISKEALKASKLLKSNKENKAECEIKGIKTNKIK